MKRKFIEQFNHFIIIRNNTICDIAIDAIKEKKGENIIMMDLKQISESVTDYLIICEATTTTQVKALTNNVISRIRKEKKISPYGEEGLAFLHWCLIDYIECVVHVFLPEIRNYYNLEDYWKDANTIDVI